MPAYLKLFIGASLQGVEKKDFSWFFRFGDRRVIGTESPWRFVTPERIAVTSEDHGHKFGLPSPVDATERVMSRLASLPVQSVSEHAETGDLFVTFGERLYLQFLQMSCGYESWHVTTHSGEAICTGGGEIAYIASTKNS